MPDFLNETIYRNDFGCRLCKEMNWECPFDTDIEEDQAPEGTVCRDFLREHISAAFSFEKENTELKEKADKAILGSVSYFNRLCKAKEIIEEVGEDIGKSIS